MRSWIGAGRCDIDIMDVERRIIGHQRGSVSVRSQPQVDEIDDGRGSGKAVEGGRITCTGPGQVLVLHWHGIDLPGWYGCGVQQACMHVSQIAVLVTRGRDPLVDLDDVNLVPGDLLFGQLGQHGPGGAAATQGKDKAPPGGHRLPGAIGHELCRCDGYTVGIRQNFNLHMGWSRHGKRVQILNLHPKNYKQLDNAVAQQRWSRMNSIELIPIPGIPMVRPGDDLGSIIGDRIEAAGVWLRSNDVVVVAQKIVSKAEGRYACLDDVTPSQEAIELAARVEKDPRLVEIVLGESHSVLRCRPGLIIVNHKLGFVMANAGVDHSNLESNHDDKWVLLLPQDPDVSSASLKETLDGRFDTQIGVVINDSVGRPWRIGTVGLALGVAGLPAVLDLRGEDDLFGRTLEVTQTGFADVVASAATLVMGEGAEGLPVVVVRGLEWSEPPTDVTPLIREPDADLFR